MKNTRFVSNEIKNNISLAISEGLTWLEILDKFNVETPIQKTIYLRFLIEEVGIDTVINLY